jgi:short-subunit dehydrogenase
MKTAAVTGAASGIGRAFCVELARRGYGLILIDRSLDAAKELAGRLEGPTAQVCGVDLTETTGLEQAAAMVRECATLELLVNSAGFGTQGNFVETDFAAQRKMIDLHVTASVTLCRAALPRMVANNAGGIINVGSVAALTRFPDAAVYTASKMFLVAFTECLEAELDRMGAGNVRVQALCPGNTRTAFNDTEAMKGYDASRMPGFMWMTPERVVELALERLAERSGTYVPLFRNQVYCALFGNRVVNRALRALRKAGVTEAILRILRG